MEDPFNLSLLAPAYIPTQSCKRASVWSLNPDGARTRLEPHIYFWSPIEARKPNLPRELRYAQLRISKKTLCSGTAAGIRFINTQNDNHLDQTMGIIWHKRNMLVSDNTAEYNVSQEKKRNYHETIHDGTVGMTSRPAGFLKQAKNRVSDWSLWGKAIAC